MTKYLGNAEFLASLAKQEHDHEIPGVGVVRIRSLTTREVHDLRHRYMSKGDDQVGMFQIESLLMAMVDPKLSKENLEAMLEGRPGIIANISDRILELSGLTEESKNGHGGGL